MLGLPQLWAFVWINGKRREIYPFQFYLGKDLDAKPDCESAMNILGLSHYLTYDEGQGFIIRVGEDPSKWPKYRN